MTNEAVHERYRELQAYLEWSDHDVRRIRAAAPLVEAALPALVDDFYAQIERHPRARRVITGGAGQIERLKGTLLRWLQELLAGVYDEAYVDGRWRVGWRHVEIGLDQVYTNVALARLRLGLARAMQAAWSGTADELAETLRSLNKLLDLDLAIIEEAYQAESSSRLQAAERLATLGQVAGGVAHELRNPLNVVKTSVYYLLNAQRPTPEKQAEHLTRIERQVGLADAVITTLSNFAKMPVPSVRPTALEPCLREALDLNVSGPTVELVIDIAQDLPSVLADADQLRIVLGNLIRNACDAMPKGGRLSVHARPTAGTVTVSIADTGIGIAAGDLSRILEPLYSTKARGLGLGLAIVRAMLEKCGGSLRIESEEGRGSTFTVSLAAAPQE